MLAMEYHKVFVANKMNESSKERYRIYGRVRRNADWLYKGIRLPALEESDILAVVDTGAYFVGTATNFAYPRPPVVTVRNGKTRLIRAEESFKDLIRNDIVAGSPAPWNTMWKGRYVSQEVEVEPCDPKGVQTSAYITSTLAHGCGGATSTLICQ